MRNSFPFLLGALVLMDERIAGGEPSVRRMSDSMHAGPNLS